MGESSGVSSPLVDRIWNIWAGSYYNIPEAIFYLLLLRGDYSSLLLGARGGILCGGISDTNTIGKLHALQALSGTA